MKVIVLDKNLRQLRELNGQMENGQFVYTEGGIFGFFGTKKKMPLDYEETVDKGKTKEAQVWFDGKDYHQIPFKKEKISNTSLNDYEREFKIYQLAKNAQVQPPITLKEIAEGLIVLALIVAVFTFVNGVNGAINHLNQTIKPYSQSIQQNAVLIQYLKNITSACIATNNATINYFKSHTIQTPTG